MAGVFQGMLMSKPEQIPDSLKPLQLWLHEWSGRMTVGELQDAKK